MKKILFAALLLPLAALAVVAPLTVSELTAGSSAVAAAEVVSWRAQTMATPSGSFPFILFHVRALRVLDGQLPPEFDVRVPGQVVDGKMVTAPDAPPLAVGQRFVLFLKAAAGTAPADAVFEVVGFGEGALPLIETAPGREPLVLLPAAESAPGRRARARLADLGATVKAARSNRGAQP